MKNAILTLIISFSILSVQANHFSQFNLTMMDHERYEVLFNNHFSGNNGNTFTINDLAPGRYPLTVARLVPTHWGLQKKVIYNGVIDIPASTNVNAVVDRFNRLQLSYAPIAYINPYNPGHCGTQPAGYYEPQPMGMHPATFSQLKNAINNQWFESGKLQVAQQGIRSNKLTAAQVAELMSLFSFESSKLEVAKMAFANTIDKQNYFIVNNEFSFSSSVRELEQYIYHL